MQRRQESSKGKHLIIIVGEGGLLAKLLRLEEGERGLICTLEKLKLEFCQLQMFLEKASSLVCG